MSERMGFGLLEGERYTEYDDFHKAEVEKVKNARLLLRMLSEIVLSEQKKGIL